MASARAEKTPEEYRAHITQEGAPALIGVVEHTYRARLGSGGRGPFELQAGAVFRPVVNICHQEDRAVDCFKGWPQATLCLSRRGVLR
jgi:hypothetical protein